jgi:SAM-dependent methyltransferase
VSQTLDEPQQRPDAAFSDERYLESNPDVREAVEQGSMASALSHFLLFGFREGRPGVSEDFRRRVAQVMALAAPHPPPELLKRVHGSENEAEFDRVGKTVALELFAAASRHAAPAEVSRLLDFGCGSGRVLRFLPLLFPGARITGSDIDSQAIAWCRGQFPGLSFQTNGIRPPLEAPAEHFDCVLGVSVFTHLPEDMQRAWLDELRRITKRTGLLLLTFANPRLIRHRLEPEQRAKLEGDGFFYHAYRSTEGLPDYYQAAWHTWAYVEKVWSEYFELLSYHPGGINSHQDLVCARPRGGR